MSVSKGISYLLIGIESLQAGENSGAHRHFLPKAVRSDSYVLLTCRWSYGQLGLGGPVPDERCHDVESVCSKQDDELASAGTANVERWFPNLVSPRRSTIAVL
jgi:hypothetical protein